MGRLANKTVMITGGARGIGAATGRLCAREGARVALTDIDVQGVQTVAEGIERAGAKARAYRQDVTDEGGWDAIVDEITDDLGGLDVLVNNAGIAIVANVEETTLAQWRRTMAVNLESVFLGTRAAIRWMKGHGGGSIVNISSIEGIIGEPLVPAYNASKGGVRIFTKSAALHCANEGYGIRVNSVHPGFVDTEMVSAAAASLPDPQGFAAQIVARHPIGRLLEPDDIAYAVLYLAADESRHVTGTELVVDGGYTAQ